MSSSSWASSPAARKVMQANRSRDTSIEWAVRRIAHSRGMRYRVNARPERDIRRTADMVFGGPRVAVFIDGCFWHGCTAHYTRPVANSDYWGDKVSRNRARDIETNNLLRERGWTVLRFWEHEKPSEVADVIERAVRGVEAHPEGSGPPSSGAASEGRRRLV
ncbi:very short patch repair endonuclease [Agromyces sp. Marseille-P2726]|uniref:very short patch repair endonuclease n=1 Tax=Agromyces sp. Marseille-P2726 TaxID=2709132 RepID=UPI00156FD285|nr:very short patch repair endonuclease [Agromyces sp. Marseille-P2726]